MNQIHHQGTSPPRRLTPVERYDMTSGDLPLLGDSQAFASPSPFHTSFLAAEQFNHTHQRAGADDISPVSSNDSTHDEPPHSYLGRQRSSPSGVKNKKRPSHLQSQYALTDETSIDQTSSADTAYETFVVSEAQEASCDAIPSIFPPFAPTGRRHQQKGLHHSRRRKNPPQTTSKEPGTSSRRRSCRKRRNGSRPSFDDQVDNSSVGESRSTGGGRQAHRRTGGALNWREGLGACMVVSVEAYGHQCLRAYDSCDESKEQPFPFRCHDSFQNASNNKGYGEQNSVVLDDTGIIAGDDLDSRRYKLKSHADDISEPTFLPLVTPDEKQKYSIVANQQQDQQHGQSNAMEILENGYACTAARTQCSSAAPKATCMGDFQSMREFRLKRLFQCNEDTAVVPQARFLSELSTQDEMIHQLQIELVFLRSQLDESRANKKDAEATNKELQQKVQTLEVELGDSKETITSLRSRRERDEMSTTVTQENHNKVIDNALNRELQEANARIAALSKRVQEDEKMFLESKKALLQDLEEAKDELSKSRNKVFDLNLKQAQWEGQAGNGQQSSVLMNEDADDREAVKGELHPKDLLEKSLEMEEAKQEIIRLNLELAKAASRSDAQSADLLELEALRSTKVELQDELSRLLIQKEGQDDKVGLLEEKCEMLEGELQILRSQTAEINEKSAGEMANLRDRLTRSELELECEKSRIMLKENELYEKYQTLEQDFMKEVHSQKSDITSSEMSALQEQLNIAEMEMKTLKSALREAEAKEQDFDQAWLTLEGKLWEMQNKYTRQNDLCSHVADHYIRRLSQEHVDLQSCTNEKLLIEDTCRRLEEELGVKRHHSVRNKAEVSKARVEVELISRELSIVTQERDALRESTEKHMAEVVKTQEQLVEANCKWNDLQRTNSKLKSERESHLADLAKLQTKYHLQLEACGRSSDFYICRYSRAMDDCGWHIKVIDELEDKCQKQEEEIGHLSSKMTELATIRLWQEEEIRCLTTRATEQEDQCHNQEVESKSLERERECQDHGEESRCLPSVAGQGSQTQIRCLRGEEGELETEDQDQESKNRNLMENNSTMAEQCQMQQVVIKCLMRENAEFARRCKKQEEYIQCLVSKKADSDKKRQQLEEEVKLQLCITREQSEKSQVVMSKAREHLITVETSLKTLAQDASKRRQILQHEITELKLKAAFQVDLLSTAAAHHMRQHDAISCECAKIEAKCNSLEEELKSRANVARESSENNKIAAKRVRKEISRVEEEARGLKALALEAEIKWRESEKDRDNTRLELEQTQQELKKARTISILFELEAFNQLKEMKRDLNKATVERDQQSTYFSFSNIQFDQSLSNESFRTCDSFCTPSDRRASMESCPASRARRASIESFHTCPTFSSKRRMSIESFKTCTTFADRRASIKQLDIACTTKSGAPKRKTFALELNGLWNELLLLSSFPQQSVSPILTFSPSRSDRASDSSSPHPLPDSPPQNKAEQLKKQLRKKELEMNERFQKHTKERSGISQELEQTREELQQCQAKLQDLQDEVKVSKRNPESKAKEEIRVLRSLIEDSEKASERSHEQLLSSQRREHDLITEVEELNATNLKQQESIMAFRRELEEILMLLQETKLRWREDAQRFDEELKVRTEKEANLKEEIKALKDCLDQACGMRKILPPLIPSPSACNGAIKNDVRSDFNPNWNSHSPVGTLRSCPHDEPPISRLMFKNSYSKTPQRDNRTSYNAAVEDILADDEQESFIGVIDASRQPPLDCTASVSTITFKAHSDVALLMPTLLDGSLTKQRGRSVIAPTQRTEESASNASESSVLSPPIISAAAVLSNLPEPVPVRMHPSINQPPSSVPLDRVAATSEFIVSGRER